MSLFAANVLMASIIRSSGNVHERIQLQPGKSDVGPTPSNVLPQNKVHPAVIYSTSKRIKVIPYANVRQVLALVLLAIWPVVLGTAFNIYGFHEASEYLAVRVDVKEYQQRFVDVQDVVNVLVQEQDLMLTEMLDPNVNRRKLVERFYSVTSDHINQLDVKYPELTINHARVTPAKIIKSLSRWAEKAKKDPNIQLAQMIMNVTSVISKVKQFYAAYHVTSLKGGETWNNLLQQLFPTEVIYRMKDVDTLGSFAYDKTAPGQPLDAQLRLYILRRYMRAMYGLELLEKYTIGRFRPDVLKSTCTSCNWTYPRMQSYKYWRSILLDAAYMDRPENLQTLLIRTKDYYDFRNANASVILSTLLADVRYQAEQTLQAAKDNVGVVFQDELETSGVIFGVVLGILICWLGLISNLFGLFGTSLSSIFSESYRFQWIQLCRRRAIEREKTRSDKIVAEMFFEVNFKHLYEGQLPPMVVYEEATIAFVELMQYEQLCKIYSSVDHVAILDWYYHLVSTAVKSFSVNLVATAGHYCLLAGTNTYHAENVALALLRLMTLARESFLPPPHQNRLPLIKGGMHSGRVAGAIVSLKFPLFTMLGDSVNTAARMNSKSKSFRVLMSAPTHSIIQTNFGTHEAGTFNVKGKGEMVAFWLIDCKWDAFASNKIDLRESDELARHHDLDSHSKNTRHGRTAIGRSTRQDDLWSSLGAGRGSSFGSSAGAGLGSTLLQGLLKAKRKKRKHSKSHNTKSLPARRTEPTTVSHITKLDDQPYCETPTKKSLFPWLTRLRHRTPSHSETVSLASQVEVKASPNNSYYIQVANTATMRSWKQK